MPSSIAANLDAVTGQIRDAERAACREAGSVGLIAVSKFHPAEAVGEVLAAGHRVFGENRVQEARAKYSVLREAWPGLELHLIGPLQTNKAEEAVRLFDVIETLDRPSLADALARAIRKTGKAPRLYAEVNIGHEPQKAGAAPERLEEFLDYCRKGCGLDVSGLMCIPPQGEDPEPHFRRLRQLADAFRLPHVSMGMSADFAAAIRCGATEVRVGTAIFGERPSKT